MCPLASWEAAPCDALVPRSWQCTTHAEAVVQAFGANAPNRRCLCAICAKQAMYLRVLLPYRESEQTAPRDALLFGSWQCNTYTAIYNIKRFALSGLVHPHSDACVQPVLPRSCVYVSPALLRGRTGCTMRCFGAWELAMHHARRGSSSNLRG